MTQKITITTPDDWHLHLREGAYIATAVQDTARTFARALVMPNLVTPVRTVKEAGVYRNQILSYLPEGSGFQPQMTLYLTAEIPVSEIKKAFQSGFISAIKLYPAGATTNSSAGVRSWKEIVPVLEELQDCGMPLSIHGEVTDPDVDIFDREKVFIDTTLSEIVRAFPGLRIVLEHLTTREGVQFIESTAENIVATITVHHLLLNRNDLLVGGIKPHYYCLPIVKTEKDRQALLEAATSGHPGYFLGTDSAPHPRFQKESAVGKAGIYSADSALCLYAELFEAVGRLNRLEGFASFYGADFYGLPRNRGTITLEKAAEETTPEVVTYHDQELVPLTAGRQISWRVSDLEGI